MSKRTIPLSILIILSLISLTACNQLYSNGSSSNQLTALPTATQVVLGQGTTPSGDSGDLLAAYQGTLENIYTNVNPSVVNISVVKKVDSSTSDLSQIPGFPFFSLPQGQKPQQQYESALGSGFIWDTNGDIVTNNHVIDGADKIEVTFSDGTIVPATVVGTDPDSDLAVIKVDVSASLLNPVTLGDSNTVKVGQLAIAIGNPFGFEGTMTTGIISAVGRSLPIDETAAQSYTIPDVIQTDAPINPGNSGGVLIDVQGQVIGVTSDIVSSGGDNAGIGFAIPSAIVGKVVPALIQDGKYVHSWLGISGLTLVPDLAIAMNLETTQRGALVEEVLPNSPAEEAGLVASNMEVTIDGQTVHVGGDVITAIDSQSVNGIEDLIAYLASSTAVGQKVSLTILRNGKQKRVDLILAARPTTEQSLDLSDHLREPASTGVTLGIVGMTVNESIISEMDLPSGQQGVLVEQVQSGSLADTAGLRAGTKSVMLNGQQATIGGDIITGVNGQAVTNINELKAILSQLHSNQELTLAILRDGKDIQITLQPGN